MDKLTINAAKTRVAHWLDSVSVSADERRATLAGFDVMRRTLPQRESWREARAVWIGGTQGLIAESRHGRVMVGSTKAGLSVGSVMPGWGYGWSNLIKHREAYDTISWFLHFARQYIHRSDVLGVLLAVYDETAEAFHPFGAIGHFSRYSDQHPFPGDDEALMHVIVGLTPPEPRGTSERDETVVSLDDLWLTANLLDPHIHQAGHQLLRAADLESHGFLAEAVVARHCILEIALDFARARSLCGPAAAITDLPSILALPDLGEAIGLLSVTRNHFGAHPGGWRWWDFEEMYGDPRGTFLIADRRRVPHPGHCAVSSDWSPRGATSITFSFLTNEADSWTAWF